MTIRLDVHAHLLPLRREDIEGIAGAEWHEDGHLVLDGNPLKKRELYEPRRLIAWMDAQGVQQAWVSPPPSAYRARLDAAESAAWACRVNEAMAARVSEFARLEAMAYLPMRHPEAALEAGRSAVERGQRLFSMPAGDPIGGRMLSDEAYRPLWEMLDDAKCFLLLHPAGACDARFSRFSLTNLLAGPTETAIAAAHLAMSGTIERYTGITMCLAHGGGTTAAVAGRLQRGQDTGREGAYLGGEKVRAALRRLCVDCITHDADALQLVASVFGEGRVLFGSDWPFDMGVPEPRETMSQWPAAMAEAVSRRNPEALLRTLHGSAHEEAAR
jgi:aminocarboxymuconate-semialdehyde decarboxylase